jgi:hypothetical protein
MDTIVKGLRPFRLAKFEGDAAFVYAVHDAVDGSMPQDAIESAYFQFRRRVRDLKRASTCECKACAAMGDLDFKFVAHHGEMVKHKSRTQAKAGGEPVPGITACTARTRSSTKHWIGGRLITLP